MGDFGEKVAIPNDQKKAIRRLWNLENSIFKFGDFVETPVALQ